MVEECQFILYKEVFFQPTCVCLAWLPVVISILYFRGWFGDVVDENSRYHLEPLDDTSDVSLTHSLTCSFTRSLARSLTHSLTPFFHSLMDHMLSIGNGTQNVKARHMW